MKISNIFLLCLVFFSLFSCQRRFESEINKRLKNFKKVGIENHVLEGTTVPIINAYFSNRPSYPYYRNAISLNRKMDKYRDNANAFSRNDKVRHCYIGFIVAKNHYYKTAVFVAFYKEAQDVGDANRRTHFEIADKEATIFGADLYMEGESIQRCHEAEDLYQ